MSATLTHPARYVQAAQRRSKPCSRDALKRFLSILSRSLKACQKCFSGGLVSRRH